MPDLGLGKTILPLRVSANTDVRKSPISSSFVIPFFASLAERVPLGMTTPSKTTSSAFFFLDMRESVPRPQLRRRKARPEFGKLFPKGAIILSILTLRDYGAKMPRQMVRA
jgi:hypothetical protein